MRRGMGLKAVEGYRRRRSCFVKDLSEITAPGKMAGWIAAGSRCKQYH